MAIENGTGVQIRFIAESTVGTIPSTPTFAVFRCTSRNINLTKNLLESAEVATHGEETTVRHGFNQVEGNLNTEFVTGNADAWIAAALRGTWTSAFSPAAAINCSATNPATFTRAAGDWVAEGVKPGDIVTTAGFSNTVNNGKWQVVTVTTTTLVVAVSSVTSKQLTTEASDAGNTVTFAGKRTSMGTTLTTFSVERAFTGTSVFQQFMGVAPNGFTLNVQPEQVVMLEIPVLGLKSQTPTGTTASTGGTPTAAPTGEPYDAFSGGVLINTNQVGVLTGLSLTVNLNRTLVPVVGDRFSPSIFEARAQVSGDATVMFENATLYNLFYNETETKIGIRLHDPNGTDAVGIYLPRVKFNTGPMDPGQTGPVLETFSYRALRDSTLGYSISWFRTNTTP